MANKFTRFLQGTLGGLTNPKGQQGNFQHATKLFVDDTYRLSPRTKFLFYVLFEINTSALKSPTFTNRHTQEVGLLVKSTDLPKYNFDSVVKNQYNRKKIIYKNFNYDPVNITLHDDSNGIVNALWALYYGYYVADRANPDAAYSATQYRKAQDNRSAFRYGLDNNVSEPFLKSINIFTMSRRRFLGYKLVNPRIKSWNHGDVAYAENDTVQSQMTVEYESVQYTGGNVAYGSPKGFATLHYDALPSPLSVAGGGVSNLLGPGGVLDGLESIFGDVSNGTAFSTPGNFLSTAIRTINTARNLNNLSVEGLKREAVNILSSPGAVAAAASTITGVVGAVFPRNTTQTANFETTASTRAVTRNPDGTRAGTTTRFQ